MSLIPSSPYLSSSSSVETTLSSSSLSGSNSLSSSLASVHKESWVSEDDEDEGWKGGVSLRQGWEFLDENKQGGGGIRKVQGGTQPAAEDEAEVGGVEKDGKEVGRRRREGSGDDTNRVSVAETVKPINRNGSNPMLSLTDLPPSPSSWIRKSRSSSIGEIDFNHLPTPPSFPARVDDVQPSAINTSSSGSSTASSSNQNGVRPLPTPSSSFSKGIRPLPTPPALVQPSPPTLVSAPFPTPPSSTFTPEPRRQRTATHTTTTSNDSTTTLSTSRSASPHPATTTSHASTSNLNASAAAHKRSFSVQPQHLLARTTFGAVSAPSLPIKPSSLRGKALPPSPTNPSTEFVASNSLNSSASSSSSRRPSTGDSPNVPPFGGGGPNGLRPSPNNHLLLRINIPPSPLPLSPAPLLPPRPTPQVQKQTAQAEFAPSAAALPSTTRHASSSAASFTNDRFPAVPTSAPANVGIKNRLAAWGGIVGGVAGAVYQEANAYVNNSEPSSSPSISADTNARSPKPLHHVLFSAPGTAVRNFNSSWRGTGGVKSTLAAASSSSVEGGKRIVSSYDPNGPAGVLAKQREGKVFGREVGGAGEAWGLVLGQRVGGKKGKGKATSGEEGAGAALVTGRGKEVLPALVVRCVDYLEAWGPREEGIFRISGRATHVQKLRNQFDTGADIDLSLSDPSELDPHAVASVFKAYLRELPSPILTSALTPAFDVVLRKYTGSPARDNGFGISSVARPEGTSRSVAEEKAALIKEVKKLLVQLPEVYWWLLKAVVCLLDHTSKFSHENKMTLSNLLLVFCPSLCLSPPFLRLLVENHATLLDQAPSPPSDSTSTLPSNPPVLPPRLKAAASSAPVATLPSNPPASRNSSPRKKVSTADPDPPRLEVHVLPTSPLPSFDSLEKDESTPGRKGLSSSASSGSKLDVPQAGAGIGGGIPSAWNGGSIAKRKNLSSPPRAAGSQDEGLDGLLAASSTPSLAKDQPSFYPHRQNSSAVDLPVSAFTSAPSSSLLFSPPIANTADTSPRRSSEGTSLTSPASDAPPQADVLPPSGVVAARRHIFGTPISDRFKSTSTPTFHSFRRTSNSSTPPQDSLAPLSTKNAFHRGGGGGGAGFFGGGGANKPVGSVSLKSSDGGVGGKKAGMWRRGSAMVGLGGGLGLTGAGGEDMLSRTVLDAVKVLEGSGGTSSNSKAARE